MTQSGYFFLSLTTLITQIQALIFTKVSAVIRHILQASIEEQITGGVNTNVLKASITARKNKSLMKHAMHIR